MTPTIFPRAESGAARPGDVDGRCRLVCGHIGLGNPRIADDSAAGGSTAAAIRLDYPLDSIRRLRDPVTGWRPRLDPGARILLAGGDAVRVLRELELEARIVPDLVFHGMARPARI